MLACVCGSDLWYYHGTMISKELEQQMNCCLHLSRRMARIESPSRSGSFASVMICTCGHTVVVKLPGSVMYNSGTRDGLELEE